MPYLLLGSEEEAGASDGLDHLQTTVLSRAEPIQEIHREMESLAAESQIHADLHRCDQKVQCSN
jgi:hypothetical protein